MLVPPPGRVLACFKFKRKLNIKNKEKRGAKKIS